MLTALAFLLFNGVSYVLALTRGPFWGLFAYMNIYFNTPNPRLNWWANYLPFDRWSLITTVVLLTSLIIHWSKTSDHKLASIKWFPWFFLISGVVSVTNPVNRDLAIHYLYLLFTYGLIAFVIVKSIVDLKHLRLFLLAIIGFAGYLGVGAYLYGERINARLENFGSADANGSNEFAVLLVAILPFIFAFLKNGRNYERVVAFLSLPFVVNAIILCNSRGAIVALVGAIGWAMVVIADNQMRRRLVVALLIALPVFIYLTDEEYNQRFATLIGIGDAIEDAGTARKLSSGRTEIWLYGLEMAKDHPFGVGPDGFSEMARFYMPPDVLTYHPGTEYGVRSAHNSYLQILVEQGVLGFIVWMGLCWHTCLVLFRAFKRSSEYDEIKPFWKDNIFAMNVAFFSILLASMINSRIYYEFFWWQIAMAVVAYSIFTKLAKGEERAKPTPRMRRMAA